MTQQPFPRAALRGAVDLSSLGAPKPEPGAGAASGGGSLRVDVTEATFQNCVMTTAEVPALVVVWSSASPATEQAVTSAVQVAELCERRLRVFAVDVDVMPQVAAAFQVQQVPATLALIAGQPMPLFVGLQPADRVLPIAKEILTVAAQNGVTGVVPGGADDPGAKEHQASPYQAAEDALARGDSATASAEYEALLQLNPNDAEALSGMARIALLERCAGVNPTEVRAQAAAGDLQAQLVVADLDVVGGHVEDAFTRLLDLVRASTGDDRHAARTRLLTLFDVVGAADPRVVQARRDLMSALF